MPQWSRIGRLKREAFPKLTGGGHTFGGGAGAGALKTLAGRLLCDTYLSARELVKEVDYTLSTLAGSLLKQQRSELSSADVPGASMHRHLLLRPTPVKLLFQRRFRHNYTNTGHEIVMNHRESCAQRSKLRKPQPDLSSRERVHSYCAGKYESASKLMTLIKHAESDAWLGLGLSFHLSVLPLTRQLACLSGFLWSRTLQARFAVKLTQQWCPDLSTNCNTMRIIHQQQQVLRAT